MMAIAGILTCVLRPLCGGRCCWMVAHGRVQQKNKRPFPALCDSVAVQEKHVLSYTYGVLSAWEHMIEKSTPLSPCDEFLMHGMYDQGSHPSVSMYLKGGEVRYRHLNKCVRC